MPRRILVDVPFLAVIFPLFLVASGCLTASSQDQSGEGGDSQVKEIVVEGAILKTIESTSIATQVTGLLQEVVVKEGNKVKKGQEIAKIDDALIQLQLEKALVSLDATKKKQGSEIDLKLAEKSQTVAESEYKRALSANASVQNAYPVSEVERLKLLLDRSMLEVDRAKFQREMVAMDIASAEIECKQSRETLKRHRVVAPCDGVVVAVEKRAGEWVEPGTVVLKIVQIDRLRIEGFVQAENALPNLVGSKAMVEVTNGDELLEMTAELVFVSLDANPLNSQVRVFLEVDNTAGKLRPGLRPKTVIQRPK